MERDWLADRLRAGASYEAIGRELGCSASKVSYWARKHGLSSAHTARHAAREPLDPDTLIALVEDGASIREIARALERSPTTIRHWLQRLGAESPMARRRNEGAIAVAAGADEAILTCATHGPTRHVRRFRCVVCRSAAVSARRRRVKRLLLEEAGGRCVLCGYDRCVASLHFHHLDPATKKLRARDHRRHPLAGGGACGSPEVRRALRELPR